MNRTLPQPLVGCGSSLCVARWLAIGNRTYSSKADLRRLDIEPAKAGFAGVAATLVAWCAKH